MSNYQCQCQSEHHGHKPGECENVAKVEGEICEACIAKDAGETLGPLSEPVRPRGSPAALEAAADVGQPPTADEPPADDKIVKPPTGDD